MSEVQAIPILIVAFFEVYNKELYNSSMYNGKQLDIKLKSKKELYTTSME